MQKQTMSEKQFWTDRLASTGSHEDQLGLISDLASWFDAKQELKLLQMLSKMFCILMFCISAFHSVAYLNLS